MNLEQIKSVCHMGSISSSLSAITLGVAAFTVWPDKPVLSVTLTIMTFVSLVAAVVQYNAGRFIEEHN